jgi:DNA repair exonuclease SbcCD ATPase subunit
MVERDATKCQGCLSELTSEVKAFSCPKCKTVIALGVSECPTCGLRFKVKTIKPKETPEDDQFLVKLIEWGKDGTDKRPEGTSASLETAGATATPRAEPPARSPVTSAEPKDLTRLALLKDSIKDLMANRSQMLERMERRIEEEKARLAKIAVMDEKTADASQVEAEIVSLADEMADITMLQAHMEALSDEVSSLLDSVEISDEAKQRGLAARALKKKLEAKEKEVEELKSKEEQLVKREEMVDRKIHAYAQKKKELDDREAELQARLSELEMDREKLQGLHSEAVGAGTEMERERAREEWQEEQTQLKKRLLGMKVSITAHRLGKDAVEAEMKNLETNLDATIAQLEEQIGALISEKADLQAKIQEASVVDEDLRKLLKVLDQMLGQLPEEAIERFSKSDDFTLYERILDKLKI